MPNALASDLDLRLGRSMAKVRTQFLKINAKRAKEFLSASTSNDKVDCRPSINKMWIESANLEPILAYLSNQ